ncbi:MAG: 2-C-methyl-D-erythritol 4-phosphate cytidylyltransferase [Clostridia bacterium]|nr:2-C-methyl-D-erythritol 4-phosphate cytidylyltransferase [Clostridia bacterium]
MLSFFRKKKTLTTCCIVPAAGLGTRMGALGGHGKQLLTIAGLPMIVHTLQALEQAETIAEVVVVTREEDIPEIGRLVSQYGLCKTKQIVTGGASRMESVARGLAALPPCDYVAIHDGARPLCPPAHIDQIVRAAHTFGAAVPGLPVRDSVKTRLGLLVKEDVNRDTLVTVQTPQVFPTEEYDAVLAYALDKKLQVTDDAAVYAILQKPIHIVEGLRRNLKVTTPEDLPLAEFYLETEEEQR